MSPLRSKAAAWRPACFQGKEIKRERADHDSLAHWHFLWPNLTVFVFPDVSLTVADKDTKEILAKYNIPVKYLRPFHHYHCALVLVSHVSQESPTL